MNDSNSKLVQRFLAKPDIHHKWEAVYRTTENEEFLEQAFDYIIRLLDVPNQSVFLDAGCGVCSHSVRLANRGFKVQAVDCSQSILKEAKLNVKSKGLENRITVNCADILSLPFRNETFSHILCWGVLMHIPDLERAMAELSRVLKPAGILIVSEVNMYSLQSRLLRILRQLLRKEKDVVKLTPAGLEHWSSSSAGKLLTRESDLTWLIDNFVINGFRVKKRISGQFTEAYTRFSSETVRNLIHGFNKLWFSYIRSPYPAFGNIVILQKDE